MEERKNDIRRLKKEADISTVVAYCGLRKGRRIGNAQFVECPNPEHDDEHPTNAYYREGWNTVYCTTCGKNMGAIDILMWCCGLEYGAAADILWDLEGRPDWYYAEPTPKASETKHEFHVSNSELALLGMSFSSSVALPCRESKFRQKCDVEKDFLYQYTGNGYCLVNMKQVRWDDFLTSRTSSQLIRKKCEDAEARFVKIEKKLHATGLFREEREKLRALASRASEVV